MKTVIAKLGNMRKAAEFVVCPVSNAQPNEIYIQSDKRIAKFNTQTRKGVLSNGKGHPGFAALVFNTTDIEVSQEFVNECLAKQYKSGDCIGVGVYVA